MEDRDFLVHPRAHVVGFHDDLRSLHDPPVEVQGQMGPSNSRTLGTLSRFRVVGGGDFRRPLADHTKVRPSLSDHGCVEF